MRDLSHEDIRRVMGRLVKAEASVQEFSSFAVLLKAAGLGQKEVADLFSEALSEVPEGNEVLDDRIREVLDFIVGFCSSHSRIFPEDDSVAFDPPK